jgi:hypothetical protein
MGWAREGGTDLGGVVAASAMATSLEWDGRTVETDEADESDWEWGAGGGR